MTPPDAPKAEASATAAGPRPAVLSCADASEKPQMDTLRKRADFLKAARARRQGTSSFLLQGRNRGEGEPASGIRVGYTCSKKVGNAVFRNHAKRRLREAARLVIPEMGREGWDYVLIGKKNDTSARPFDLLLKDLKYAMRKIHGDAR
ncbi:MAG: ribonuclease P protein component [Alphaproteobacteria bacterium]|uniref:Ribonuclease P protein component n=1 Tax=Celeribacter baekdonensis TaxID=875171 RepID=A0A1G7S2P8_9RHOB|nr:ribonuclease P protein component [Celeribacter baekdonensis]MBU0645722.1 ribonuclease P protein component [Alphaproteobacteria bacterium]MBU1277737.1 ribonuclease P protein component [Alphaproteobacteria bacterium]MBU1572315.1 ribonuclease P protein component [Alphaproteobacteria bacterium]MBU1829383.1 ribonuclease P protein component [Alphaproteobacteria bacterium]MBU2078582.1 ribonuclease P protein component [Alphaproteobacteria bacterium]